MLSDILSEKPMFSPGKEHTVSLAANKTLISWSEVPLLPVPSVYHQ